MKKLAAINSLKNGDNASDDSNLLLNYYKKINTIKTNSVLALYLDPSSQKPTTQKCADIIFPFGSNSSQIQAVQNALTNQLSIISGPPGTGKTQTILNIIANILIQNKTVLVVSNNNSAIKNVLEKLEKYNLDFIAALLGNKENKELFIQNQKVAYPEYFTEQKINETDNCLLRKNFLEKIKRIFKNEEDLSIKNAERAQLNLEAEYFHKSHPPQQFKIRKKYSSNHYLKFWFEVEDFAKKHLDFSFFFKLKMRFIYGIGNWDFLKNDPLSIIAFFKQLFYASKKNELNEEISNLENELKRLDKETIFKHYTECCFELLKYKLSKKYRKKGSRKFFEEKDLYKKSNEVLEEYPVILSTTFSSIKSLNPSTEYDYVIMDEASQIGIAEGALAFANAKNAVIVGDSKQLPNVIDNETKEKIQDILNEYEIPSSYNGALSFLDSLKMVFPQIKEVQLKEHYRCNPQIINFCNQKFYANNLLVMTKGNYSEKTLSVLKTVAGNHARGKFNEREADEIKCIIDYLVNKERKYSPDEIGIIAPYNAQVAILNSKMQELNLSIEISTVHKFQGREKEVIILSTVDNEIATNTSKKSFVDDPNLLNVAVSRAKQELILVTSQQMDATQNNIADLISYIKYNNGSINNGNIHSVFDYLYACYEKERNNLLKNKKKASEFASENLLYNLLLDVLQKEHPELQIICHQPLREILNDLRLIQDKTLLEYATHPWTHLDFLVYNAVTKMPVLAIEVDGYAYHSKGAQKERDNIKNQILEIYNIPLLRLSTTGSDEKTQILHALKKAGY